LFTYRACHDPLEGDYPHSEVRAFDGDDQHLATKDSVPEELHLEWRIMLREASVALIPPRENRAIRQHCPVSHELEPMS
jgi:hypothetical protein